MNKLIQEILLGFLEIFKSPAKDWSVFWLLAPIFLFWIILEIYFDKHKKEALGWNTALGNGLSLFWVTISCLKFIFALMMSHDITTSFGTEVFWRMVAIFFIFTYSIFIIWVSFKHNIKDKYFYPIASPTPIYYLSAVIVLLAYGVLNFSWIIIFDLFILYWVILGLELLIRRYVPEDDTSSENDTLSGGSGVDSFGSPSYGSPTSSSFDSQASTPSTISNNNPFASNNPTSNTSNDDPFKF
ncbi:hypothetical protein C0585_04145 [Candidatus Woesearchaeota archaeon]|nr:MAG: hypothetical protein C0585_04145 [Candidatus Woesearchaeota archaeon]